MLQLSPHQFHNRETTMTLSLTRVLRSIPLIALSLASLGAFATHSMTAHSAETVPTVYHPQGKYEAVTIALPHGLPHPEAKSTEPTPAQTLSLGFRQGKLVSWWFSPPLYNYTQPLAEGVTLNEKTLQGEFQVLLYAGSYRGGGHGEKATLAFDLKRQDDRFSGKYSIAMSGDNARAIEGEATGNMRLPSSPYDPKASWPSFAGPLESLATTNPGPTLIDDLAQAKPLWQSEARIPIAYGNAADDRYANKASAARAAGGSSSPVYDNGVVYIGFYSPNRSIAPKVPDHKAEFFSPEALRALAQEKNLYPDEIAALEDHWRELADDQMVAMDARTGATLWKTSWPLRTANKQTHKHRGAMGVPLVADGKVFYPNLHGRLLVMDAKSGEPLWEFPKYLGPPETKIAPLGPPSKSPVLFDKILVWHDGNSIVGLNAESGQVEWQNQRDPRGRSDYSLRRVTLDGRDLLLTCTSPSGVRLIDPANGKTLWSDDALTVGDPVVANQIAIAGDTLVGYQVTPSASGESKSGEHRVNAWRISKSGLSPLWESEPIEPDEGPHLGISRGTVYAVGHHEMRALDLKTGKMLANVTEQKFPHAEGQLGDVPRSNPALIIAGDKLILSPEGQHGKHGFILFDADPTKLTLLGSTTEKWIPPHPSTTAYARQPLLHPVVDGRIFFRGGNGIYCYDLRQPNSQ